MGSNEFLFFAGSLVIITSSIAFKNKKRYFLLLLTVFFPFETGVILYHYNGIWLVDTVLVALLVLGVFQKKLKFYISHISFPILITLFLGLISSYLAIKSGWAFNELTKHIRAYLIFICVYSLIENKKDLDIVIYSLMAGLIFQGLLGLYQWRVGPLGLWFLGELMWDSWRSSGTFSHPSYFSNYFILFLPMVVRLTVFSKMKKTLPKIIYYSALIFGTIGLFTSFARGPWVAFAIVMVVMVIASTLQKKWRPRNKFAVMISVLFILAFMYRYTSSILIQFEKGTGRDKSTETRIPLIKVGLNMMMKNAMFGVGLSNYEYVSYKYISVALNSGMDRDNLRQMVHNSFVLMGAETGIPALIFFILFFIILFKRSYKVIKCQIPLLSNISFGLSMGLISVFISLMASPDYHIYQVLSGMWLACGLLLSTEKIYLNVKRSVRLEMLQLKNVASSELEVNAIN